LSCNPQIDNRRPVIAHLVEITLPSDSVQVLEGLPLRHRSDHLSQGCFNGGFRSQEATDLHRFVQQSSVDLDATVHLGDLCTLRSKS